MHQRLGVLVVVLALATAGVAGTGAAASSTGASGAAAQEDTATVTFQNQTSGGQTVTVRSVTMPEGGFVAIHDGSLNEGETLASVVGSSAYLPAGTHENVTVQLDEPVSNDTTLVAMPHKDTDGDRSYQFVPSQGEVDGPYTTDGDIVLESANVTVSAAVAFADQPSDGNSVLVDSVTLSEDGFVTIRDETLLEGETFESVRGWTYLTAGTHEDVRVTLDEPLAENQTIIPMPHRDTNDNEEYDFVSSDGEEDGPFTADGDIVVDTARTTVTAQTTITDQTSDGSTVTVDSVTVHDGGFVTIHDGTLLDGETFGSVRGSSDYLAPGTHEDVTVQLDDPYEQDGTAIAMPHRDTDGDESYDFVSSDGADDGPYVAGGDIVLASAALTVEGASDATPTDGSTGDDSTATDEPTDQMGTETDDDGGQANTEPTETTQTGQPGFGVVAAVVALLAAALVVVRRR